MRARRASAVVLPAPRNPPTITNRTAMIAPPRTPKHPGRRCSSIFSRIGRGPGWSLRCDGTRNRWTPMKPIRLMTLAPGHFHAALVQKRMHPAVAPRSYVYGPLDSDTASHFECIAAFNTRRDDPTAWELDLRV